MFICMSELFQFEIVQKSSDTSKIQFNDPYEVIKWARYFKVNKPNELLIAFCFYLLKTLKLRVQDAVDTQRLDGRRMDSLYKELSLHYKKHNPKNKGRFWQDTEFLIDSIKVWQDSKRKVFFGIPKSIKHPQSNTPAYLIFQWLEFGTKKNGKQVIPPRPLIYPHLYFMLTHINDYWQRFIWLIMDKKIKIKH